MRRFFCENCGEEVAEDQEVCPHCGAIFVAIKCPRCGYRGKQHEFFKGCPSCGFMGEHRVRDTRGEGGAEFAAVSRHGGGDDSVVADGGWGRIDGDASNPRRVAGGWPQRSVAWFGTGQGGAPGWLFALVLFFMIAAFAALAILYTRI